MWNLLKIFKSRAAETAQAAETDHAALRAQAVDQYQKITRDIIDLCRSQGFVTNYKEASSKSGEIMLTKDRCSEKFSVFLMHGYVTNHGNRYDYALTSRGHTIAPFPFGEETAKNVGGIMLSIAKLPLLARDPKP